jgi:hypothetical protein
MDSNRCSCQHRNQPPDRLAALEADLDALAAQDRDRLTDAALADQALRPRRLLDRLEGQWLGDLAAVDARGRPGPTRASRRLRRPAGSATGCA